MDHDDGTATDHRRWPETSSPSGVMPATEHPPDTTRLAPAPEAIRVVKFNERLAKVDDDRSHFGDAGAAINGAHPIPRPESESEPETQIKLPRKRRKVINGKPASQSDSQSATPSRAKPP